MLRSISFEQLLEWEEFDKVDPIGGKRGDWQVASLCSLFMNLHLAEKGSTKRFRTQDFLLEFGSERPVVNAPAAPKQSWQEMKMIGMMMAAASNGKRSRR